MVSAMVIPIVIIYNMVFYQPGSLSLILFSFGSAFLIFFAYLALFKDRPIYKATIGAVASGPNKAMAKGKPSHPMLV
jgi:hypothetical protein